MKIVFNNGQKTSEKLMVISKNIVKILSQNGANLSGFKVYTEHDDLLGDYSDFTTLYKQEEDGYILSNDGSVYKKPVVEEYKSNLEEVKSQKLFEISNQCEQKIYNGFDISYMDKVRHYSLTIQDQLNLLDIKEKMNKGEIQFEYHADGEPYKYFNKEDMLEIIETAEAFKNYEKAYCNNLMQYVKALQTNEEVEAVKYGNEIPLKYRTEILNKQIVLL